VGDADAFSELVRLHSRQIYGLSLKMLRNREDAEDNLKNVFCKVFDNINWFKFQSRLSTWLIRIAMNEALMKLRKLLSERSNGHADISNFETEEGIVPDIENRRPNPERQYIAKEPATIASLGLRPLSRDEFLLHKAEGWTSRELAGVLGITVETVKSRLFRAHIHMRQQLNAVANNRSVA
jgi:RNA polymerase sigma-70 factor (ECF subfamily)